MKRRQAKNRAASVHRRLLNLARERRDEFHLVLTHYAIERLLYRVSQSAHADRFILKGAMLMAVWTSRPYRPTRDLDLLGGGDSSVDALEAAFRDICRVETEADGLAFDESSVQGDVIREDQEYEGVRITLLAMLGKARISVQVDIGFGDAVVPPPLPLTYPTLLDSPAPRLRAYSRETAVSEKLQAMVVLGPMNSRMKDFYDVWLLARMFDFKGSVLSEAIQATFDRRRTPVPGGIPHALTDEFALEPMKQTQWAAFVSRGRFIENPPPLDEIVAALRAFVVEPMLGARVGPGFAKKWTPGGPWC